MSVLEQKWLLSRHDFIRWTIGNVRTKCSFRKWKLSLSIAHSYEYFPVKCRRFAFLFIAPEIYMIKCLSWTFSRLYKHWMIGPIYANSMPFKKMMPNDEHSTFKCSWARNKNNTKKKIKMIRIENETTENTKWG